MAKFKTTQNNPMTNTSRPRVVLSAAMSIDGKITGAQGNSIKLSSDADTARVHRLRAKHDAILIGINTVMIDDPLLTVRHAKLHTTKHNPIRIILDSRARIPLESKIITTSSDDIKTIIVVSKMAPKRKISKLLQNSSVDVLIMGKQTIDVKKLLEHMVVNLGIRSVMVEGGSTVNWEFIQKRLFDEIIIAVSPCVLGGNGRDKNQGVVSLVGGDGFTQISDSPKLHLKSSRRLGDHVILSYTPSL